MKRLLFVVVPVVLLLGCFLIYWYQPELVVKRRVTAFLKAASVEEGTGALIKQTRGDAVRKFLAEKITLDGPAGVDDDYTHSSYSREDLVTMYTSLALSAKSISIQEPVFESVDIDGDQAVVHAEVTASVNAQGRNIMSGAQKMTLTWVKGADGWQLSKAQWTTPGS